MSKSNINATQLKKMLTLKDYESILNDLNAEWKVMNDNQWVLYTGCHNLDWHDGSPKLYFYPETRFFMCYTGCNESFDIYTLIDKRWQLENKEFTFYDILIYVCRLCNIPVDELEYRPQPQKSWQELLSRYTNKKNHVVEMKTYDKWVLNFLRPVYHTEFLNDGITKDTLDKFNVRYYRYGQQITIPVYSPSGELVGIHARNLCPTLVDAGYKYIPLALSSGEEYRFKTSQVLYGLNINKGNIEYTQSIILTEAPKSVMQLDSMLEYNNSVALFGMNLSRTQRDIILDMGVQTVIIALDKQYHDMSEDDEKTQEFIQFENHVLKIAKLFSGFCNVYVIYDKDNKLGYKDSPSDKGKAVWEILYNSKELIE